MAELILSRDERLSLKGRAHHLHPVVLLGAAGLTDAVIKEVERALTAHELIKVRVPGDDRDAREAIFTSLADQLGAARIQMIGKLIVLFRPRPPEAAPETTRGTPARSAKPQAATKKSRQTPAFRPKAGGDEIRQSGRRVAPRRAPGRAR